MNLKRKSGNNFYLKFNEIFNAVNNLNGVKHKEVTPKSLGSELALRLTEHID